MRKDLFACALGLAMAAACGGGGDPATDSRSDGADAVVTDLATEAVAAVEAAQDSAGEASDASDATDAAPETCEGVMKDWQCLAADPGRCGSWAACLGEGSCAEPPCWGFCERYPGVCLPDSGKACTSDADCGSSATCIGAAGGLPGLCRGRPAGACWVDADCGGGQYCAGEVPCRPEAYCAGIAWFGKCRAVPAAGQCFEASDCAVGMRCDGEVLCGTDDTACGGDKPGTCAQGDAPGCLADADCAQSADGHQCTAAQVCPDGQTCSVADRKGFCRAAAGIGRCWEDSDCKEGVCRDAVTCPPGSLCWSSYMHAGFCGDPMLPGEGVAIEVLGQAVKNASYSVLVRNMGAANVYLDPCYAVFAQYKTGATWADVAPLPYGPFVDACATGTAEGLVRLGPGDALAAGGTWQAAGTYRLDVGYKVGCTLGVPSGKCTGASGTADSAEIQVK